MSHQNKGFTLIELLVVVLIIGILASIALPQYMRAVEKARASEGIQMLETVAKGQIAHYLATNTFAQNLNELDIEIPGINATVNGAAVGTNKAVVSNFLITNSVGDFGNGHTFAQIWAERANNGVVITGDGSQDNQYTLMFTVEPDGTFSQRRCGRSNRNFFKLLILLFVLGCKCTTISPNHR